MKRVGMYSQLRLFAALLATLPAACTQSHPSQDVGVDANLSVDSHVAPDVSIPDLGTDLPRLDLGPLDCGEMVATVFYEFPIPSEPLTLGPGHVDCDALGVTASANEEQQLVAQAQASCSSWPHLFEGVLCTVPLSSDVLSEQDLDTLCWLDALAGGDRTWACLIFTE